MSSPWTPVLFALAAAGLLRPLTAALSYQPLVDDPGPCAPRRDASAPAGQRGYARFHANDSLIGRPIPCTRDHKICFRHNLIFDPELDRCQPVAGRRNVGCDLSPNRNEFEHGSGRIVGICRKYEDPCTGYRMAYDGRCYPKEIVRDVICGCRAKPTRHFMGDVECRSVLPTPINVQQPQGEGQCLIPDLRFPDIERLVFFENPFNNIQGFQAYPDAIGFKEKSPRLICASNQAACFSQTKVFVSGFRGCHDLLEKGPCPDEHLVAMDIEGTLRGRAEAVCVHERGGCPRGYKRMLFDGQCHEDRELKVGAPGHAVRNQFGQFLVIPHGFSVSSFPEKKEGDFCEITVTGVAPGLAERRPKPPCGPNDKGLCDLYEVESTPPKPQL